MAVVLKGLLLLLAVFATAVYTLPNGASELACETLAAQHSSTVPQTTDSPFILDLSMFGVSAGFYYTPGETYTLTLRDPGDSENTFRGFLVQSRLVADDMTRVGTFVDNLVGGQIGPCEPMDSSVTHVDNSNKTMVSMDWVAPAAGTGSIRFAYAVVKRFEIHWANLRSEEIQEVTDCSTVECPTGETCIVPYENATPVCVCTEGYAYNPNTEQCEIGDVTLPVRLDATEVAYNGPCSELDTADERAAIYQAVRDTVTKSLAHEPQT